MGLKKIELKSFAKINLHLDITGKLDSGFHELYSVFQLITLYDEIKIKIENIKSNSENDKIRIRGNFSCSEKDNLIYRIILGFEEKSGINQSYEIDVEKNIPDGAGLGGGSSNAASVLYYLNKENNFPLDENQLLEIAEKNGSDIPFFLKAVTAVVKGRGEKVKPVEVDLSDYQIVIACPDFRISTKDAYELYDKNNYDNYKSFEFSSNQISALLKKQPGEWGFFNSFTPVLTEKEPVYSDLFSIFKEGGSDYFNITGSGSAVYGIFSNSRNSEKTGEKLRKILPFVWNGKMLAGKPLLEL